MKLPLSLLLAAATLTAHAGPEDWLKGGLVSPDMIQTLRSDLNLTPEQEGKMQSIISSAQEEGSGLEKTVREEQKALNSLLRTPDTSAEAAAAALDRLLAAEAPVKQLQLRTLIRLRDVLTPEQQRLAVKLAPGRAGQTDDMALRVRQKAEKLRAEVESLGIKPTRALSERGAQIESLIRAGDWQAAEAALTRLSKDAQVDVAESTEEIDFTPHATGSTDLEDLKARYAALEEKGQDIISLPLIRRLLQAREALEQAKQDQDAEKVGRILTWAEKQVGLTE